MLSNIEKVRPTPRQLEYQAWEMGLFLHFGIRTYYEGHSDWDGKTMPAEAFLPNKLDCRQWIRTAKDAGMNYAVLVAKHHDGFALWPSDFTDYSVAHSPWRNGDGDVVREFIDACREYDIRPGLYYSPADSSSDDFVERPDNYDDYFIAQISELLTHYGDIDILWFDGSGSENHTYNWGRIITEIRRLQPNILIFNMGDPDFRWAGNESGLAPWPCWNTVNAVPFSVHTDRKEMFNDRGLVWLPAECDFRMRESNWFYSEHDEHTVKSVEELLGIYYYSVGRGANFLMNIGPNRDGLLPEADRQRLLEFGQEIRDRFRSPLASLADFKEEEDGCWTYYGQSPMLIDHVVMQEDLSAGESIHRFKVEVMPTHAQQPVTVFEGYNVGHKSICSFPPVRAKGVRIHVTKKSGRPRLRSVHIFHVGSFQS